MFLLTRLRESVRELGPLRTARLVVYSVVLPILAVAPLSLKEPQRPARLAIFALLAAVIALLLLPRVRARVVGAWDRSALLRGADTVLWNTLLVCALAEATLTLAARVSSHPLLAAPNARASWHIAEVRNGLREASEADDARNPGGFNDAAWAMPKPPGLVRIAALGDSFAYGIVGYERNFLTRLEPDLAARMGRSVEIANLGLPGLQPRDYLYLLEHEGLALEPDALLLCFYAGNDFDRNKPSSWLALQHYRFYEFARRAALLVAEGWRRAHEYGDREAAPRPPTESPPGTVTSEPPSFSVAAYHRILTDYAALLRVDPDEKTQWRITSTLAVLDRIVALAAPRPVAIAVLPSELQVDRGLQETMQQELGLAPGSLDLDRPFRLIADHFAGRGVRVVDLRPAILAAHRDAPAYHPRETHWNARGNAAAAAALTDALADWLREPSAVAARPQ